MAALPSTVRRYETWLCSVFSAAGAVSPQTASTRRPVPTTWPACKANVARTAFRRSPLTGSISPPSMTSTGPSSRTRMTLPVLMRANAPRLGTFGGGLRFNESQYFYSFVSDTDKVPRRSAPFRHGPSRASGEAGTGTVRPHDVRRTGRELARGGPPERAPAFSVLRIGISTDVTLAAGAGPFSCENCALPANTGFRYVLEATADAWRAARVR